jgi:betaine reductase
MMAGAMDLEDQWKVLQLIRTYGKEKLIVLLGCPDAESSQIQAETVSRGDPSLAGPLTNQSSRLPVIHMIEQRVLELIPQDIYAKHISRYAEKLDHDSIQQRMDSLRCTVSLSKPPSEKSINPETPVAKRGFRSSRAAQQRQRPDG